MCYWWLIKNLQVLLCVFGNENEFKWQYFVLGMYKESQVMTDKAPKCELKVNKSTNGFSNNNSLLWDNWDHLQYIGLYIGTVLQLC